MRSAGGFPLLTRRMSRRSFTAGSLVTGGMLAAALNRAVGVAAATFGPGDEVVTTDYVNYRDAPGLSSTILAVLPPDRPAVVHDSGTDKDGYTWYLIGIATGGNNPTGYVAGAFLASSGGGNFPVGSRIMVNTDALNVRDKAGLSGSVINVVTFGTVGDVTRAAVSADGYSWIQVAFSKVVGWVATEFVRAYSGGGGKFTTGDWVYVNSGPLNVRSSPSLNGSILRTLPTGDAAQIADGPRSADGYIWYKTEIITGEQGWVVQDFLSAGNPPPNGAVGVGDTIKVVDGPLNIRSGPGTGYSVVDVAATAAIAKVADGPTSANGHTWIEIDGNLLEVGWVAFEFCQIA